MSEPKHTPGPWRVSNSGISILCGVPDPDAGFPNGVPLAHVCAFGSFDNRCADARLIAAAPELLAACEAALLHIQPDVEDEVNEEREGRAIRLHDLLLAAIARAKGD